MFIIIVRKLCTWYIYPPKRLRFCKIDQFPSEFKYSHDGESKRIDHFIVKYKLQNLYIKTMIHSWLL